MILINKQIPQPDRAAPLILLILAGAMLEVVYLSLWVFGYPISQAPDWSVAYLTQHETVWETFKPFLEAAQLRWPTEMTETETLTRVLMLLFTAAFLAYGVALWAARGLSGRVVLVGTIIWAMIHQ